MTKDKRNGATAALRQAIAESDLTRNEIARRANIDPGMVSRFVRGERGATLWTASKIADVLGLEIVLRPKRQKKGR